MNMIKIRSAYSVLQVLLVVFACGLLRAATVDGNLRVEVLTAYNLVVDSNAGTPSSYAPQAAYIGATFHNDGTASITDLVANIGDFAAGTPGIYPSRAHPGLTGPLPGGEFAFSHEGGSAGVADATRYIPEIPAGESITVYWLIGYDQLDENGVPLWGKSVKPDDDLWLEYDIWATAEEGASTRNVDITRTFTFRNEISASPNKILPNGANKVPDYYKELFSQFDPAWTNAYYDGSVGSQITTEGIWYDLGNVGHGFDNDGDLVPDKNAWMQPIGNPAIFDSGAFRLVKTYAYVIVKLKGGGELVLSGEDQLYFMNIPENNGAVGFVQYFFMPLQPNARAMTSPYQEVASGFDNEKFNADYGIALGEELMSGDALVLVDKTASVSAVYPGDSISYSVAYTNSSPNVSAGNRDAGLPLVVQDSIPEGSTYVADSASAGNTLPAGVSSYTILYSTDDGATWSTTQPAASLVTDIQWWLDGNLDPEEAGAITFSVDVDDPFNESAPVVENEAGVSFGNTLPFDTDKTITLVLGNNSLGDTVFADTGVGGGVNGNAIQDGTEPGLGGITVSLYYDSNGNGEVDAGEPLLGTEVTDGSGKYSFTLLPDGNYVAVVDVLDADLPYGYTVTTEEAIAADLDSGSATTTAVDFEDADFGFTPALGLSKTRNFSGTVYEGQEISYTLSVENTIFGDGSGSASVAQYTVWPTSGATGAGNKSWINASNAWNPDEPDGSYAEAPYDNAGESIQTLNYNYDSQPGTITNVTLLLPMVLVNPENFKTKSELEVDVYNGGTSPIFAQVYSCTSLSDGIMEIDITSAQTIWSWSDFDGSTFYVEIVADKASNEQAGILLDSVGVQITTDQIFGEASDSTTLDPVLLDDFYDTAKLQFVSASPSVDSVTTNSGIATLHWDNLGPILPGGQEDVTVTFTVLEPAGNVATEFTNTASVTEAYFLTGIPANQAEDEVVDTAQPSGTIGDYVWRDVDGAGDQDAGEPGVAGVTVQLTPPATVDLGAGAGVAITTVTDADGYYLFTGLPGSGDYTVAVITSSFPDGGTGAVQTYDFDDGTGPFGTANSAVVTIDHDSTTGGDTELGADFGYTLPEVIRGTLWHDRDQGAEPAPESGEELFSGVTVTLYESDGVTVVDTTTTAADGTYEFVGNYLGTYVVEVDDTTGDLGTGTWFAFYDTDDISTENTVTVSVVNNGEAVADFSYYQTGTSAVGDTLFIDWDGNGTQDPLTDVGIAGITLLLFQDENTNGVVDATDAYIASTVTAANGYYLFDALPAGTYNVQVDRTSTGFPSLYSRTADPDGILDDQSSVILTTTTNLLQDFGYQPYGFNSIGDTVWYDADGDGVQGGVTETGISNVTVRLYVDINNDGVWTQISTALTDANGNYLFEDLPDADYRVTVDSTGSGIPDDAFGNDWSPTTPTFYEVTLSSSQTYLDADFGFAPLGAIGDTIYWDSNGNADQDWTEPGVPGVTVNLYVDVNGDGVYIPADDGVVPVATEITDSNGNYLFTGLLADNYVVDVVDTTGPLAGSTLTGDPENDGVPCPIPAPDPVDPTCDGQTGVAILPGTFFMGADFGYQPPGVIGDLVWIDLNTNGVYDVGEQPIPYVTVSLYDGVGTLVATNVTDGDGLYNFANLEDGTYRVEVDTNDSDFPANLTASYDADGTADSVANTIVISDGHIEFIGGTAVSTVGLETDLSIDFGYRYIGDNSLSGTVGMDDPASKDGLMNGTDPSGPGANEYAFSGVDVNLLLWTDDGDSIVESGEYITIATTSTDANGDYSFDNLPSAISNEQYIVSIATPVSELKLTTSTGDTDATLVVNTTNVLGQTQSSYQVVTIVPDQENIDFAFETDSTIERDYGDLPVSYSTTIGDLPVGPSHEIITDLYLGTGVEADPNGQPTVDATGDAEEDGVVPVGLQWTEGVGGGEIQVSVGAGDGWLVGWIDFDQNGVFDPDEKVVDQSVSSTFNGDGVYNFSVDIPSGTFSTTNATILNARYRLYSDEPVVAAAFGPADGGEVEDYQFVRGIAGNYVWYDLDGDGIQDAGEPGASNVVVNLYESDGTTLVQSVTTAEDGSYLFNGLQPADYVITVEGPAGTAFTRQDTPADEELDSDADATGDIGTVSLTSGDAARTDIDAGLYIPAELFGYLFEDEDGDQIRGSGDTNITNALVTLIIDGVVYSNTYTDADGYYEFTNVPAGVVTVQVVRVAAELVPEPDTTDQMRSRAVYSGNDTSFVEYVVSSGYGVLSDIPGEPLNFGYDNETLSTRVDLIVYAESDGRVMIELSTVNENGNNDIEIYALINGEWVMVAMVPSEQIVGFGSNTYTVEAVGLTSGQSYMFKIVDESGHIFYTDEPVNVARAQLRGPGNQSEP